MGELSAINGVMGGKAHRLPVFHLVGMPSERGHAYDDLADVRYHLLPEAFGCRGWLTARIETVAELDAVLDRIDAHDGAAYVEVMIPNEKRQPLPAAAIDGGYKFQTAPIG